MDGLYTRCPHCQTVFRLSEQHLAAANGRVRCGACFQVFDAVNHRVRPVQKRSPELNRPAPAAGLSGASAPTGTQTGTSPAGAHLASVTSGLTAADERPAGNVHALRPASAATDAAAAVAAPNDDPTGQPQAAGMHVGAPSPDTANPVAADTSPVSARAGVDGQDRFGDIRDKPDTDSVRDRSVDATDMAADAHWTLTVDDIFAPLQGGLGAGTPDPQPLSPPPPPPASVLDTFDDLGVDLDALPVPDAGPQAGTQADSTATASAAAPDLSASADEAEGDTRADRVIADSEPAGEADAVAEHGPDEAAEQSAPANTWPQAENDAPHAGDVHSPDAPADLIDTDATAETGTATNNRATPETAVVTDAATEITTSTQDDSEAPVDQAPFDQTPAAQTPADQTPVHQPPASPAATPVTSAPRPWQAGAPVLWQLPRSTGRHIASGWSLFAEPAGRHPAPAVAPAPQDRAAETLATPASDAPATADDASAERIGASRENDIRAEPDDDAPETGIDSHTGAMADGRGDEAFTESLPATLPETQSDVLSASLSEAVTPDDALIAGDFSAEPLTDLDLQLEREIADSLAASQHAGGEITPAGSEPGFGPAADLPTEPAFHAEPDLSELNQPELALHEAGAFETDAIESGVTAPAVAEPEPGGFGSIESYSFEPEAIEAEPVDAGTAESARFDAEPFTSVTLDTDAQDTVPEPSGEAGDDRFDHSDASLLAAEAGIAAAALPDTPALADAAAAGAGAGAAEDSEPHSFGDLHDHIDHAIHPVAGDAHVHPASVVMATARPVSGLQAPEPDWRLEALDRPQPDAADFVAPRRFPWRGLLLTVLALLLLAVLVLQLLWPRRAALRDDPDFAPWVERLCTHVECELPPRRDVSRIGLLQRSVLKDASAGDQLNVELLIVNQADFAQPFPDIELRFSDIDGKVVAQRRFKPGEYLRASEAPAQMPVNVPVRISFAVVEPAVPATGFEFAFLPASP